MKYYKKSKRTLKRFLKRYSSLSLDIIRLMSYRKMVNICVEFGVVSLLFLFSLRRPKKYHFSAYDLENKSIFDLPDSNSNSFFSLDA